MHTHTCLYLKKYLDQDIGRVLNLQFLEALAFTAIILHGWLTMALLACCSLYPYLIYPLKLVWNRQSQRPIVYH